jgi:hypothetical protein
LWDISLARDLMGEAPRGTHPPPGAAVWALFEVCESAKTGDRDRDNQGVGTAGQAGKAQEVDGQAAPLVSPMARGLMLAAPGYEGSC